jgi:hypothetical protein
MFTTKMLAFLHGAEDNTLSQFGVLVGDKGGSRHFATDFFIQKKTDVWYSLDTQPPFPFSFRLLVCRE